MDRSTPIRPRPAAGHLHNSRLRASACRSPSHRRSRRLSQLQVSAPSSCGHGATAALRRGVPARWPPAARAAVYSGGIGRYSGTATGSQRSARSFRPVRRVELFVRRLGAGLGRRARRRQPDARLLARLRAVCRARSIGATGRSGSPRVGNCALRTGLDRTRRRRVGRDHCGPLRAGQARCAAQLPGRRCGSLPLCVPNSPGAGQPAAGAPCGPAHGRRRRGRTRRPRRALPEPRLARRVGMRAPALPRRRAQPSTSSRPDRDRHDRRRPCRARPPARLLSGDRGARPSTCSNRCCSVDRRQRGTGRIRDGGRAARRTTNPIL